MSINLDRRLDYIQMRRHGESLSEVVQQAIEEQTNQLQEKTNELSQILINQEKQAKEAIENLEQDFQSHEFLQVSALQNQNLKETVEKLKQIQDELTKQLTTTEAEVRDKTTQRIELQKNIVDLRKKLNQSTDQPAQYQKFICETAAKFNQYHSTLPKN